MQLNEPTAQDLKEIAENRPLKIELATKSLGWFIHLYLGHYIQFETPDFHWEIYRDLSNPELSFIEVIGFRGSAKSTIISLALPLWRAVTGQKKFIILISDTSTQAKLHIRNLISELEDNEELITDFGPFQGKQEWTAKGIILLNETRVLAISKGQKIRGLRHLEYRPDLIVGDDMENLAEVRTIEQRNKTEEWFLSDVIPAVDETHGQIVVTGSFLHTDSLLSRLKNNIKNFNDSLLREYPILLDDEPLWPKRFDKRKIEQVKAKVGNRFFLREYMLKLIPEEGRIIKTVQYYSGPSPKILKIGIGVDLAISQKQTADYTSINVLALCVDGNYYNLNNVSGRWEFGRAMEKVNEIYIGMRKAFPEAPIFLGVEDVGYQKAAIQELKTRHGLAVKPIPVTKDKRARLESVEPYFVGNQIFFRQNDDGDVVNEILNFGVEQHDDRMDSFIFSLALLLNANKPEIVWLS